MPKNLDLAELFTLSRGKSFQNSVRDVGVLKLSDISKVF